MKSEDSSGNSGLLEGNAEPDTAKCVDIATSAALKECSFRRYRRRYRCSRFGLGAEFGGMLGGGLIGCGDGFNDG